MHVYEKCVSANPCALKKNRVSNANDFRAIHCQSSLVRVFHIQFLIFYGGRLGKKELVQLKSLASFVIVDLVHVGDAQQFQNCKRE
jgi:hypothetical protein